MRGASEWNDTQQTTDSSSEGQRCSFDTIAPPLQLSKVADISPGTGVKRDRESYPIIQLQQKLIEKKEEEFQCIKEVKSYAAIVSRVLMP